MLIAEFVAQLPHLKREVKEGKLDRLKFAEMCARYGLGTTITETDTEGNDVAIRVIREPRTLLVDN